MRYDLEVVPGVGRLLEHCSGLCPSAAWEQVAALDFAGDLDYLKRWLRDLLETETPEENIVAFWFGIFDDGGPGEAPFARLYLAGSESYDPEDKTSEWACSPVYFPDGRYADSQVLRSMSTMLGTAGEGASWLGSYVLPLGYASLAGAVAVGFDSGDSITLPAISRQDTPV
jgi:hypothetical protein